MLKKTFLAFVFLVIVGASAGGAYAAPLGPFDPTLWESINAEPCPTPDDYEDDGGGTRDDSFQTASTLTSAGQSGHTFDRWMDKDWAKFEAEEGVIYTIATENLNPEYDPNGLFADTVLELYAPDGITRLDISDDYGGSNASLIEWRAPADGTYYVKAYNYNPGFYGCDVSYDLTFKTVKPLDITKTCLLYTSDAADE